MLEILCQPNTFKGNLMNKTQNQQNKWQKLALTFFSFKDEPPILSDAYN